MESMNFNLDVKPCDNENYLLNEHDLKDILLSLMKNEKRISKEVKNRHHDFNKWTKDNIVENINDIESIY